MIFYSNKFKMFKISLLSLSLSISKSHVSVSIDDDVYMMESERREKKEETHTHTHTTQQNRQYNVYRKMFRLPLSLSTSLSQNLMSLCDVSIDDV